MQLMRMAAASMSLRVDVVSDVVCPWCFIGSKRLKQLLASDVAAPFGSQVDVVWHPYRLLPATFPPTKKTQFYREKFGGGSFEKAQKHVQKEGSTCGIAFNYSETSMIGPTTDAHRLIGWVPHDKQQQLVDLLFSAYHEKGLLISDENVLADCAEQCGLDKASVLAFLKSDEGRAQVDEEIQRSPQRYSMVGGVPHFVLTIKSPVNEIKTIISGGQSEEYFKLVLERAIQRSLQAPM